MQHDAEHERLLDAVLVGDVALDAPEVATLRGSCRECRARLAEDAELELELDGSTDEVADLLEAAARGPVDGEEEALAGFRAALDLTPSARRTSRTGAWVPWFAAAAAIVLAVFAWRAWFDGGAGDGTGDGSGGRGPRLSGLVIECVEPKGTVRDAPAEGFAFRWSADDSAGTRYLLRVFDAEETLLFEADRLREPSYAPTAAQRDLLAGPVRWEVLALDSTEVVVGSGDARARFPN